MRVSLRVVRGEFNKVFFAAFYDPVADAVSATLAEAANLFLTDVKADISQGLDDKSHRWERNAKVRLYPTGRKSVDGAIWFYHRFPYAGIFERGGAVSGKPLMWIRLKNAPKKINRRAFTPKNVIAAGFKLIALHSKSGTPLLGARVEKNRAGGSRKVSVRSLVRGGTGSSRYGHTVVPLFIGIRQAQQRKRFHVGQIADSTRGKLAPLFVQKLRG